MAHEEFPMVVPSSDGIESVPILPISRIAGRLLPVDNSHLQFISSRAVRSTNTVVRRSVHHSPDSAWKVLVEQRQFCAGNRRA